MEKMLSFEISRSHSIPYVLLYNKEVVNNIKEKGFYPNSLIYFITKVKKTRFDYSSTNIQDGKLETNILYDNVKIPATIDLGSRIELDYEKSNEKVLTFRDTLTNRQSILLPTNVFRMNKINIGNKPEIIYVGYSFEPIERLEKHEKIVKAHTQLADNEEIRLYINKLKFYFFKQQQNKEIIIIDNIGIERGKVSDKQLKDFIKLSERMFINFFQTKGLNDQHINFDITKDKLAQKILHKNKIKFVSCDYDMYGGEYYDFFSKNQKFNSKSFAFNFNKPEKGFRAYEVIMKEFFEK